jgi:hypothetical protein
LPIHHARPMAKTDRGQPSGAADRHSQDRAGARSEITRDDEPTAKDFHEFYIAVVFLVRVPGFGTVFSLKCAVGTSPIRPSLALRETGSSG